MRDIEKIGIGQAVMVQLGVPTRAILFAFNTTKKSVRNFAPSSPDPWNFGGPKAPTSRTLLTIVRKPGVHCVAFQNAGGDWRPAFIKSRDILGAEADWMAQEEVKEVKRRLNAEHIARARAKSEARQDALIKLANAAGLAVKVTGGRLVITGTLAEEDDEFFNQMPS